MTSQTESSPSEMDEAFMVTNDTLMPLAHITRKHAFKADVLGINRLRVHFKVLRMPRQDKWVESYIDFDIAPYNKAAPSYLERWGLI